MPTDNELRDGDVFLRPLDEHDVTQRYVDWLNDPDVNRWLEVRWDKHAKADVLDFLARCHAEGSYLWGIWADDLHVGNIKLGPVNQRHKHADISYFIGDKAWWGKGIATKAVKLVTQFAFARLKLYRVQAGCYAGNVASAKVLRKAGFTYEGSSRRSLTTDNGRSDHNHYARLIEDNIL